MFDRVSLSGVWVLRPFRFAGRSEGEFWWIPYLSYKNVGVVAAVIWLLLLVWCSLWALVVEVLSSNSLLSIGLGAASQKLRLCGLGQVHQW